MNNINKHIIQLDGLRFFAVLMVMVAHWLQWQWTDSILTNIPFVRGVTLFFVLSGFLITSILLRHRDWYDNMQKSKAFLIKNFYARRFLRIFPIYYLLLIFLFVINYENTREIFPWLISYSSNIYQSIHNTYVGSFNHFWSLAVEEQFYLFWPFVLLFVKPNKTLNVIVLTIMLSLLTRTLLYLYVDKWMATAYFTLCCMQALGLGALLAYITKYKPNVTDNLSNPILLYSVAALYVVLLVMQNKIEMNWYKSVWEEFVFSIVSFFIILRASQSKFIGLGKFILENRFVRYAGKISYGMYVYHAFMPSLFYVLAPKIGLSISDKYVFFIALYILTFIVSVLSWNLIEAPLNKLKDKFPYRNPHPIMYNRMAHLDNHLQTDIQYVHNETVPLWIVPISGWGSDSIEKAYNRMQSYKNVAAAWGINIEFSSRLGTFKSYKKAPTVSEEIRAHNEKTFAAYEILFGADWINTFIKEVDIED